MRVGNDRLCRTASGVQVAEEFRDDGNLATFLVE